MIRIIFETLHTRNNNYIAMLRFFDVPLEVSCFSCDYIDSRTDNDDIFKESEECILKVAKL